MRFETYRLYQLWDIWLALVITMAAVEILLRLVLHYTPPASLLALDILITLILCLDVLAQWARRREIPGHLHVASHARPSAAVAMVHKVWFGMDILVALPLKFLFNAAIFPLLQVLKLARVAQRMRQWRHHEVQHTNLLRLTFFVYWIALVAHWLACGWLALDGPTKFNSEAEPPPDSFTRYLRALYWSVTTLATVGYGDLTPTGNAQVAYTMMVMLLGVGVYGYVIGNVATLLANLDVARSHYRENMERLSVFMRYHNIPAGLQRRLRDYYAYLWENRLGYDESSVLADLPDSLRSEVAVFLRRDFIERAPLFKGASHEFVREIALQLRPVVFTPGDFVFRAGQYGHNMYFISRGTVEVVAPNGQTVMTTLKDGDFFGEIALLSSQPRTASIRAVEYCDLYTLDKETFDHVLEQYPEFAAHIKEEAERRNPQNVQG